METENVETEAADEAVEVEETETDEAVEAADDAEPADEAAAIAPENLDNELFDKVNRAARLLRARRDMLRDEADEDAARLRALKLLELKLKMEQKEMAELMGMRLRELNALMIEAEKHDIVARIEPEEEDMRKASSSRARMPSSSPRPWATSARCSSRPSPPIPPSRSSRCSTRSSSRSSPWAPTTTATAVRAAAVTTAAASAATIVATASKISRTHTACG